MGYTLEQRIEVLENIIFGESSIKVPYLDFSGDSELMLPKRNKEGDIGYDAYAHDVYDVYYETRNRLYLWDKFFDFDKEYIKIDKKQQSLEFKEIRLFEKNFREKRQIINQAKNDYRLKKMGKAFEEINL